MPVWSDFRHSWRIFTRTPALALAAVAALALGIGFTTTMFGILHGGTRSLPVEEAHEIVIVTRTNPPQRIDNLDPGPFDFLRWKASLSSYEGLAAFRSIGATISGQGEPADRVSMTAMTPEGFELIAASAALGRTLATSDAVPGAPAVVVVSDELWRTRFQASPDVLGQTLRVNSEPRTIVGVMPPGFGFPVRARLWIPLVPKATAAPGDGDGLQVFGRLNDGVSVDAANLELQLEMQRLLSEFPSVYEGQSGRVFPFTELETPPDIRRALQLFVVVVSLGLLVACANVANLLLARAASRSRETAIRAALGASRARIIALHLCESAVLASVATAIGVGLATVGIRFFATASATILDAYWNDFSIDPVVALFASALGATAAIGGGLLPALRASSAGAGAVIQQSTAGAGGARIGRLGRGLVIAQIALACGLLVVTATFVLAAASLRAVDIPFDAHGILTAQFSLPGETLDNPAERRVLLGRLHEAVAAGPEFRRAAFVSAFPGRGSGHWAFTLSEEPATQRLAGVVMITPEFFELGARPMVRGRAFDWKDDERAPLVAVVNESFAARHSSGRDPVGRRLRLGEREFSIVGVAPDLLMQDVEDLNGSGIYLSMLQARPFVVRLMAETVGPPLAATPALRRAVEAVDADLPVLEVSTLYNVIYDEKKILDALAVLFLVFGVGALFLAAIGLYAVLSFAVTERTREFGVRLALGATATDIGRLVLRQTTGSVVWGLGIGLVLAFAVSRVFAAAIERLEPAGPHVFGAIAGAVLLGTAIALWRPLHRAAHLAPADALRVD